MLAQPTGPGAAIYMNYKDACGVPDRPGVRDQRFGDMEMPKGSKSAGFVQVLGHGLAYAARQVGTYSSRTAAILPPAHFKFLV